MTEILIVALAGSVGAVARYVVSGAVQGAVRTGMPVGTAAVNLVGAFLIGIVSGAGSPGSTVTVAALGFLGGFTTMSTWMVETVRLGVVPVPRRAAVVNLLVVSTVGFALAAIGFAITS